MDLIRQPLYHQNKKYLEIREIAMDHDEAVVPRQRVVCYHNALLTPTNHLFVKTKYIPTGQITTYDDKKLSFIKASYLYAKFRYANKIEYHDGDFLFAFDIWGMNYYHWTCESLPRLVSMKQHYPQATVILPLEFRKVAFVTSSLKVLKFHCLWIDTAVTHCFTRFITVQSSPLLAHVNPVLQFALKNSLLDLLHVDVQKKAWRKVYISRAKAAYRRIENEQEILPILIEHGYETVFAEDLSYREQVALFHETKSLIALHGAGFTNCMFMQPGTTVLEIRISTWDKQPLCFWRLANIFDLKWCYHLTRSSGEESNFKNITIDVDAFRQDVHAFTVEQEALQQ